MDIHSTQVITMMKDKPKIVFIDGLDNTITVEKEPYHRKMRYWIFQKKYSMLSQSGTK